MVSKKRKEWLIENKKLLLNVLEHITNVTNLGLSVTEVDHTLIITYPAHKTKNSVNSSPLLIEKAELIFSQDPNNGMKVKHRLDKEEEVVTQVPASSVNEKFIYERVIEFLERVNNTEKSIK